MTNPFPDQEELCEVFLPSAAEGLPDSNVADVVVACQRETEGRSFFVPLSEGRAVRVHACPEHIAWLELHYGRREGEFFAFEDRGTKGPET
jgi:hypothetical protein